MGFISGNPPLTRPDATFAVPTEIKYGIGKVGNLTVELQLAPDLAERTRLAVFTDAGVAAAGLLDVVRQAFADSDYTIVAVMDDVPAESDTEFVKRAAAKLNEAQVYGARPHHTDSGHSHHGWHGQ
jgi:alcohol dehydrogenase class IV